MIKYSIIVPIYNAEKFIGKTIESVLGQTFPELELILVNDGSTDRSGDVCLEYAASDPRITYISKSNGGVSDSRNEGLRRAQGEYIIFVDADDWIERDYLSSAEAILADGNADLIIMNNYYVRDGASVRAYPIDASLCDGVKNDIEELLDFSLTMGCGVYRKWHGLMRSVWAKVFRRSIISENDLAFDTGLKYGEDAAFLFAYLMHSKTVSYRDLYVYYYLDNPASAMNNQKWAGPEMGRHYFDVVERSVRHLAKEESLALLWYNIAEIDWRVLSDSDLPFLKKREEMKKMMADSNCRRFAKKESSGRCRKKQLLEAFLIRHNMPGVMILLQKAISMKNRMSSK